jgi:hypothetical protein
MVHTVLDYFQPRSRCCSFHCSRCPIAIHTAENSSHYPRPSDRVHAGSFLTLKSMLCSQPPPVHGSHCTFDLVVVKDQVHSRRSCAVHTVLASMSRCRCLPSMWMSPSSTRRPPSSCLWTLQSCCRCQVMCLHLHHQPDSQLPLLNGPAGLVAVVRTYYHD